jgi:hypothetical protein
MDSWTFAWVLSHTCSIEKFFCLKNILFLSFHKFHMKIPGKIAQALFKMGFLKGSKGLSVMVLEVSF